MMHIEKLREYCLAKAHTREGLPFDDNTLVFYVADKMFALVPINADPLQINLKCDPDRAIELREQYEAVKPGYHMSKIHWNTVYAKELSLNLFYDLIDHSYDLVVKGLTKKKKLELGLLK